VQGLGEDEPAAVGLAGPFSLSDYGDNGRHGCLFSFISWIWEQMGYVACGATGYTLVYHTHLGTILEDNVEFAPPCT
jgi:hypothetical protein